MKEKRGRVDFKDLTQSQTTIKGPMPRVRTTSCEIDFNGHVYNPGSRFCTRCGWIDYP